MTISAFIPVYKDPKKLGALAQALSAEAYPDSETVIVVDGETTQAMMPVLDMARRLPRVRVIEGNPHLGKAAALNRAVASTDASCLVFLDNDTISFPESSIFEGCVRALRHTDLTELPKLGYGRGPVAAMMKLEFLANIVGTRLVVEKTGRCPSMNGAAFAVRKDFFLAMGSFSPVINEDIDFGARAFLAGARFSIDPQLRVYNAVSETPAQWLHQRRRWAFSLGVWSTTYMASFWKQTLKTRWGMFLAGMLFPLPFLTAILAILGGLISAQAAGSQLVWRMLPAALGLASYAYSVAYYASEARRFGQRFSLAAFIPYSLVYLPIWGLSSLIGTIVARSKKTPNLGWKYTATHTHPHKPAQSAGEGD